jgi:hypothetical protein
MAIGLRRRPSQVEVQKPKRAVVPVKFTSLGTPYVDSSVSAISPQKLEELVQEQMRLREQSNR